MKRFPLFLFIVLLLTACAPAVQGFVDLPDAQEIAINGIFITAGALVLDFLIGRFPWLSFFRVYQEAWSLSISALAIHALENGLPTGSDQLSISAVALLIAAALYFLGRTFLIKRGAQGFGKE